MDRVAALNSRAIYEVLLPTWEIFTPLLQTNSAKIKAVSKTTCTYGLHPRQQLDIYTPPVSAHITHPAPILVFFYGGGLTGGERILGPAAIADGLAYAGLGAFFASRGFLTLIPDYRRVNDPSEGTGEDAVYPSGAEDLAAVLQWVEDGGLKGASDDSPDEAGENRGCDLFIMGNSAGGIHVSTWLLAPQFEVMRRAYFAGVKVVRLRGVLLGAVPFHFTKAAPARSQFLRTYYGDAAGVQQRSPFGLLEALKRTSGNGEQKQKQSELGIPPVLSLEGELEPEEIRVPGTDFVELWKEVFAEGGINEWILKGHNHISPPIALMSGDSEAEKWAEDLVLWMRDLMES